MRGLCYFFLSILTQGKSIFCAYLFSSICRVLVDIRVAECVCMCMMAGRRVVAFVGFAFQNYNCNLHLIVQFDQSRWCLPQCLPAPWKSLGTMSLCPASMTPNLRVSWVSVGDKRRCPCPNAPTPSSPPRMGLYNSGSPPGTSCWAGGQTETCPWPSWTLSGVVLVCTAAGLRSLGGSMTIRSTHTLSWRKVMLMKIIQGGSWTYSILRYFVYSSSRGTTCYRCLDTYYWWDTRWAISCKWINKVIKWWFWSKF